MGTGSPSKGRGSLQVPNTRGLPQVGRGRASLTNSDNSNSNSPAAIRRGIVY